MTTLYDYWRSSAAYRLRIALRLKGVDHDSVSVDLLTGAHKGAENRARNPQGLVPSLDIDGAMLTQSLAILDYLEETRPEPPLLPSAPLDRHRVRALAHMIALDVHPVCNLSVAKYGIELGGGAVTMQSWHARFTTPALDAFEQTLTTCAGTYCFGDRVTLADVVLIPQIYNARRWQVPLPYPTMMGVVERLNDLPAVAGAHPDLHQA